MNEQMSDNSILKALGSRVETIRLNRNVTQQQLAEQAGISHPTLVRLERGDSVQLTTLIRVLRALNLLKNLDLLIPEPPPSPIQQAKLAGRTRQRASSTKPAKPAARGEWVWGEDK